MLKHRLFATLFLVLTALSISAQQMDIIVIGQVLDGDDGMPIEGAKVSFVGGKSFTLTNDEGYFYLASPKQERAVLVEMSGYKSKRQKLDRSLRDQAIEVVLQKDLNLLEEVVVTPSKNKMREILSGIDKNRHVNSSENLYGFEAEIRTFDKLYIAGIQRRLLEKRLFSEIRKGMLMERDSSLILPVHFSRNVVKKTFQEGKDSTKTIEEQSNTLELFGENNIREIIEAYVPTVDFYRRNVLMFGKTFPSPTSKNGLLYYRYTIRDSIFADNSLSYLIDFRPKNLKSLAFRGTMLIDAKTFALRHIEAEIPNSANLNFLKDIAFEQSFFEATDRRFLPERKEQTVSFFYDFSLGEHRYASAILKQQQELGNFRLLGDSLKIKQLEPQDPAEAEAMQAAIDTLNQTKLQKTLVAIADVLLNGYIHVGKIDVGVVYDMLRWNPTEGFRPTLSLRTGESLSRHFTVGGYVGYGFKDKEWKFGGNASLRFGKSHRNTLSATYNRDVYRWGYADKPLLNENMIGSGENLLTSFSWGQRYDYLYYKQQASLAYVFEKSNFRFAVEPSFADYYNLGENTLSEPFQRLSLRAQGRFSWQESFADGYFRKFYTPTQFPIVTLEAEAGRILSSEPNYYAKLTLALKHDFSFTLGKISYSLLASKIINKVPQPLLIQPMTMQGIWYNNHNFMLAGQGEFFANSYASLFFRYNSNGLVFNNIPLIKRLNLRETLFAQLAYGTLSEKHYPQLAERSLSQPYIEAGCGITNIFRLLAVEAVWRLTHRNSHYAPNWGIRARFYLDF